MKMKKDKKALGKDFMELQLFICQTKKTIWRVEGVVGGIKSH